jgi:hypothetical protein
MTAPYEHVFISYSHQDRKQAEELQAKLEAAGLKVWRDPRLDDEAGKPYPDSIDAAIKSARRVIVLWSHNSIRSRWVKAEAERASTLPHPDDPGTTGKLIPISLDGCELPLPHNILHAIPIGRINQDFDILLRTLSVSGAVGAAPVIIAAKADISKLPETYAKKLYGRDREMSALLQAWDDAGTRIFAFDAMGGAGKTALVYHFVQGLKASGWRGARSIFAWSFYSQGSNEDRQTSADDFFKAAYRHFGGKDATPPRDPHQKGVDLAHLVQAQRSLLILDGMEPLQYAAGRTGGGTSSAGIVGGVKDPGIKALLNLLADNNPGLCVVTTRIKLAELRDAHGVIFEELDRLPLMAGIELLRDLGVEPNFPPLAPSLRGASPRSNPGAADAGVEQAALDRHGAKAPRDDGGEADTHHNDVSYQLPQRVEFQSLVPAYSPPAAYMPPPADARPALPARIAKELIAAVEELKGHALALTLIGKDLAENHRGDIRAAGDLPALPHIHPSDPARDAYRVMRSIEIGLARQIEEQRGGTAKPAETAAGRQLALLFFLGFFDRPAETAHLPVVFPLAAVDYVQPDEADLELAKKDLLALKGRLEDLAEEREKTDRESRKQQIEQEQDAIRAERDEAVEAARRTLVRRVFAGLAENVRDRSKLVEALRELVRRGLIAKSGESSPFDKASIDCHPLVREYFGARLKELDRETFKAAHGRLYDHYRYAGLPQAFRGPVAYALLADQCAFPDYGAKKTIDDLLSGRMNERTKANTPRPLVEAAPDQLRKAAALIGGTEWDAALKRFLPEDEAGMTPLFAAIAHGCAAEREAECWSEVYRPRIARGNEAFAARKLGLFGQELAALAAFFETPFTKPSPRLSPAVQALALNQAGFRLRALGRLEDAAEPMRAAVEEYVAQENWEQASLNSGNLSGLLLTIGRIAGGDGAGTAGEAAVAFADRSRDAGMRSIMRTAHADALFQAGSLARASALFREAEALQKETQPGLPRLYSLQGYGYCALLLARGRAAEAAARADYALAATMQGKQVSLDIALATLAQARAALAQAPLASPAPAACAALSEKALAALRRANAEEFVMRGLLAHAEALWRCGDANAAGEPLREAETIAARGPMPLFLADAHLLRARIALSQRNFAEAAKQRAAASGLIAEHGYGSAAPKLAVLDAEIACAQNAEGREALLAAAMKAIRGEPYRDARTGIGIDGGWWGLLPRLEALLPADAPELASLRAARDAYNAERDAYLAAEEADLEAKLAKEWAEEDRALADPDFRRELNSVLVANGYKPLDETPVSEQRSDARNYLKRKREAQGKGKAREVPEVPDALLDQLLANPEALEALNAMLKEAGIPETIDKLGREAQRQAVAALMAMAQKQQDAAEEEPDIPEELVHRVFAEAQFQDLLRDIMQRNDLSGAPAGLPMETKRAIVAALMKQGFIEEEKVPQAKAPPPPQPGGGKKRGGWWPFGRKR